MTLEYLGVHGVMVLTVEKSWKIISDHFSGLGRASGRVCRCLCLNNNVWSKWGRHLTSFWHNLGHTRKFTVTGEIFFRLMMHVTRWLNILNRQRSAQNTCTGIQCLLTINSKYYWDLKWQETNKETRITWVKSEDPRPTLVCYTDAILNCLLLQKWSVRLKVKAFCTLTEYS